jgi:hypothetical protein
MSFVIIVRCKDSGFFIIVQIYNKKSEEERTRMNEKHTPLNQL